MRRPLQNPQQPRPQDVRHLIKPLRLCHLPSFPVTLHFINSSYEPKTTSIRYLPKMFEKCALAPEETTVR